MSSKHLAQIDENNHLEFTLKHVPAGYIIGGFQASSSPHQVPLIFEEMNHRTPILFFLLLIISSLLLCSTWWLGGQTLQQDMHQEKKQAGDHLYKAGSVEEDLDHLMGAEECVEGDEFCIKRRMIAEAHLDYIYTQQHKP